MSDAEIFIAVRSDGNGARIIKRDLDDIANSGDRATNSADRLRKALVAIGGVSAALVFLRSATRASIEFSTAMSELSTLLGDTKGEMEALTKAAKQQAVQFASTPVQQSKALYQIISAGASSAAQATETLTAANKLAIGGVTDISIAADGLTSVLNAYGDRVESAAAVSDSLFIAMKAGKTTIGELSAGLGKVAPIAASVGVEFDELTAAVSALTKGGISTQESITGVRAVLAAVAKPTSEASKMAEQLGIDFTATGLEAKGLAEFLSDLTEKTGGSTEKLAQLFGGVEALVPIMALSGEAGKSFYEILEDMGVKAGATEEAFNKMADSPGFKLNSFLAAVKVQMLEVGDLAVTKLAPALSTITENLTSIVKWSAVAAAGLLGLGAASVIASLGGAAGAVRSITTAVKGLTVAVASNPIGLLVTAISSGTAALVLFKDEIGNALKETEFLGKNGAQVFFNFRNIIIEGFKGIASILSSPFLVALDTIKSVYGQAVQLYNKIPMTTDIPLSDDVKRLAGMSFAEINLARGRDIINGSSDFLNRVRNRTRADLEELNTSISTSDTGSGKSSNENEVTDLIEDIKSGMGDVNKEAGKLNDNLNDEIPSAIDDLTSDIERDLAGAFKDAFKESEGGFKRFIEGAKASFTDFLAEIAYQATLRPIMLSIGASVAGVGMSSSGANAAGLGSIISGGSGGGFSLSNLGSISNIFSGGNPITLGGMFPGGIGQSLGFGQALPSGVYGPAAPGSIFGSATLGSTLAGGAIGGLAANLLGLGNSNMFVNAGASTLGALAGQALIPIPGVGAGIGSFLGSALGGLFGGSTPSQFSGTDVDFRNGAFTKGNLSHDEASSSQRKAFKSLQSTAMDVLNETISTLGLDVASAGTLRFSTSGKRDGGRIRVGVSGVDSFSSRDRDLRNNGVRGFSDADKALEYGVLRVLSNADYSGITDELESAITKAFSMNSNLENALSDVALIQSILGEQVETVNPLKQALSALDDQFSALKDRAVALGLPLDKITEGYEAQRKNIVNSALGGLQDFLDSQALSSGSSLSNVERLSLARSEFDKSIQGINSGDYTNINAVANQASTLLGLGRDIFASSEAYASLEAYVRQTVTGIADTLGAPGGLTDDISRDIAVSNAEQTSIMQQLLTEMKALREENTRLRKANERFGNAVVKMNA